MRIMQLYRIEDDYRRHKKRLASINKVDSLEKIKNITQQHFYLTNQHVRIKNNAAQFHQQQELTRRQHDLVLRNQNISTYGRKHHSQTQIQLFPSNNKLQSQLAIQKLQNGTRFEAKSKVALPSMQRENKSKRANSLMRHSKYSKLDEQLRNNHEKQKRRWERVKSVYGSYRLDSQKHITRRHNLKEPLLSLLKNQFRLDAKVLFPKPKNRRQTISVLEQSNCSKEKSKVGQ